MFVERQTSEGSGMMQWWLNLRWASEAHSETLAKIDLALLTLGATVLVLAFAARF